MFNAPSSLRRTLTVALAALALAGTASVADAGPRPMQNLPEQIVTANETVGIFTEAGDVRLDLGSRAMKEEVPASHDSWATRLVIKRLDGPSEGFVQEGHVIGIFTEDGSTRLDLGTQAVKENVPASHDSWATRLEIRPLNRDGRGPLRYGEVVGVFSEDGRVRLDLGTRAMKMNVPATHDSWATRLQIKELD